MSTRTVVLIAVVNGLLALALLVTIVTTPAAVERALASAGLYATSSSPVFVANPSTNPVLNVQVPQPSAPLILANVDPCTLDSFMVTGANTLIASGPPITMIGRTAFIVFTQTQPGLPARWVASCSTATSSVRGLSWAVLAKPLLNPGQ